MARTRIIVANIGMPNPLSSGYTLAELNAELQECEIVHPELVTFDGNTLIVVVRYVPDPLRGKSWRAFHLQSGTDTKQFNDHLSDLGGQWSHDSLILRQSGDALVALLQK